MEDESKLGSIGQSKFERTAAKNASLVSDILGFLSQSKKWWLLPVMGTLLVLGVMVLLSTTAAAPFVYTLF
jgi:Family of unknown function (DUF5989)